MARNEDIDALMMGHLYGELSEADASSFELMLTENPELQAELAAHQQTREAFGQLEAEDPPQSISAQLLHEAAKRAPASKRPAVEGPGMWQRLLQWFEPLMAHPAMASVAALLLVGGVAGALYVRGVDAPVHPRATTEAPAPTLPAAARAPAPTNLPDEATPDDGLELELAEGEADEDAFEQNLEAKPALERAAGSKLGAAGELDVLDARLASKEQEKALRKQKQDKSVGKRERLAYKSDTKQKVPAPSKKAPRSKKAPMGNKDSFDFGPVANAVSGADPVLEAPEVAKPGAQVQRSGATGGEKIVVSDRTLGKGEGQPSTSAGRGYRSESVTPRQAPARDQAAPAAPPPKFADDEGLASLADEEAPYAQSVESRSDPDRNNKDSKAEKLARSLHGKLNRALAGKKRSRKSRCRDAARIANDILDRNPSYFYARVEGSKSMAPCRLYVAQETRSRRAKRARKAAKKTGNAAPAELDTAEAAQ